MGDGACVVNTLINEYGISREGFTQSLLLTNVQMTHHCVINICPPNRVSLKSLLYLHLDKYQ